LWRKRGRILEIVFAEIARQHIRISSIKYQQSEEIGYYGLL